MTSLGIGRVASDRKAKAKADTCPRCGAGPERRIDGGGFGGKSIVNCGRCAYEFPQEPADGAVG